MRYLVIITALIALSGAAQAETVRSQTHEATAERRAVQLRAQDGSGTIAAQQVLISVRRLDGQPAGEAAFAFAEEIACGGAVPMVSIAVGAAGDAARYDILCRTDG